MVRLLMDSNTILDVLLDRNPWNVEASKVWDAHVDGKFTGYIGASAITDLFYIGRKFVGVQKAKEKVATCLATFEIVAVDRKLLENALSLIGSDFEDNVQIACIKQEGLDGIVTRDPKDFVAAGITVLSPTDLLKKLGIS